jgi:uncharacterized damage-inducible protein DinB
MLKAEVAEWSVESRPMTHQDICTLLDFHYWSRDRMFEAVSTLSPEQYTRDLGSSFKSVRDTVVHIYAAELIWYMRWQGASPSALASADQFPDVASIQTAWAELESKVRDFVAGLDDEGVGRVIPYTLLSGVSSSSPLWQMLQHVVNHGSYHRGQVTTLLRQLGAAPAKSCDMIAFYRERSVNAPSA